MKRKIKSLVVALVSIASISNVNAQAFELGKSYVSLGYGYALVNWNKLFFDSYTVLPNYKSSNIGPLTLQYEYAVAPKFGIGFSLGYTGGSTTWNDDLVDENGTTLSNVEVKYSVRKITANLRGTVHFAEHEKLDPYFAFGLGYKNFSLKAESVVDDLPYEIEIKGLPVSMELRFGTRYLFHPKLGVFIDAGMGHGFIQGGLVGKF